MEGANPFSLWSGQVLLICSSVCWFQCAHSGLGVLPHESLEDWPLSWEVVARDLLRGVWHHMFIWDILGLPLVFPSWLGADGGFFQIGCLDGRRAVGGWKCWHGLVDGGSLWLFEASFVPHTGCGAMDPHQYPGSLGEANDPNSRLNSDSQTKES